MSVLYMSLNSHFSNVTGTNLSLTGSKSYIIDEAHFTEQECNITADGTLNVCCPVDFKKGIVVPPEPPSPRLEQALSLQFVTIIGQDNNPGVNPSAPPGYLNGGTSIAPWPAPPITSNYNAQYSIDLPAAIYTAQSFAWHIDTSAFLDTRAVSHPVRIMMNAYALNWGQSVGILGDAVGYTMNWCDNTYQYFGQYIAGGQYEPGLLSDAIPSTDALTGKWALNTSKKNGGAPNVYGNVANGLIGITALDGSALTTASISYMKSLLGLDPLKSLPTATDTSTWIGGVNVPVAPLASYSGPQSAAQFPKIYESENAFETDALTALETRIAHLESLH